MAAVCVTGLKVLSLNVAVFAVVAVLVVVEVVLVDVDTSAVFLVVGFAVLDEAAAGAFTIGFFGCGDSSLGRTGTFILFTVVKKAIFSLVKKKLD